MSAPKLPRLRLLQQAIRAQGPHGLCIHRSAAFVLDVPGSILCFGTFDPADDEQLKEDPRLSTVPFIHAWAEWRGFVYAPTTIERCEGKLVPMNRAGYLRLNGARDLKQLTRPELLRLDRELGLKRALRLNMPCKGGASFGGSLLDAAGVLWKDYGDGGVVPADLEMAS